MSISPQHRIYMCFFLFAVSLGAFFSRVPDLQQSLEVSKAELGLILIGAAVGALCSLTVSSKIVQKLGARYTAFATVIGTSAMLAIVPWATTPSMVFAILFFEGLLAGALEINLNVEMDRIEAQLGQSVMNRAHGFWSLGFFVIALISSAIRQAEISMQAHLMTVFVCVAVAGTITIYGMENAAPRSNIEHEKPPLFALPTVALLPLCLIGVAAFLIEGAGVDWSAIYMRDVFVVDPFVQGLGLTFFTLFMAIARLTADPVVDRYGPRAVALGLLTLSGFGLLIVWLAPSAVAALAGFALLGAGCSAGYPLAVSAAAQRTDRPAHQNVAALAQMSFVVFFCAPPLLGFVAEHFSVRTSYVACLPVIIAAMLSVRSLSSARKA